ncbi:MAG: response regulator transcription factor [Leucobacter sp.]
MGIVDDHPAVVYGLVALMNVQMDMRIAATGATVTEMLDDAPRLDVVLLDLFLADGSTPTDNLEELRMTGARVLIYSSGDRPALIREASRSGGFGMIRKSTSAAETLAAVRAAARREVVASADWAAALDLDTAFVGQVLTRREAEVLELYASGETAERVGAQLYVSRETVLDHIRRIRTKYEEHGRPARTKVDLYRRAVEDGIIRGAEV